MTEQPKILFLAVPHAKHIFSSLSFIVENLFSNLFFRVIFLSRQCVFFVFGILTIIFSSLITSSLLISSFRMLSNRLLCKQPQWLRMNNNISYNVRRNNNNDDVDEPYLLFQWPRRIHSTCYMNHKYLEWLSEWVCLGYDDMVKGRIDFLLHRNFMEYEQKIEWI